VENLKRRAAATDWTPWIIVALGAFHPICETSRDLREASGLVDRSDRNAPSATMIHGVQSSQPRAA